MWKTYTKKIMTFHQKTYELKYMHIHTVKKVWKDIYQIVVGAAMEGGGVYWWEGSKQGREGSNW